MESKYCLITTTCDSKEIADKITNNLLDKKLAACVQSININSSYHWKGKIENTDEILLQIKTKKSLYNKIEKEILLFTNYETPQIVSYEIKDGFKGYLDWINNETL